MRRRRAGYVAPVLAGGLGLPALLAGLLGFLDQPRRDFLAWRYLQLGQAALSRRPLDRAGAAGDLRRAVELGRREPLLVSQAARLMIACEDYSGALDALGAAPPVSLDDRLSYGQCLLMTGRKEEGARLIFLCVTAAQGERRNGLMSPATFATLMNNAGYALVEGGVHLEAALRMTEAAVAAAPLQPAFCDSKGWALYRLERPREARFYLERAVRHQLPHPDAVLLYHLGAAYAATRQVSDAGRMLEWSLAQDPGRSDAEALLRHLRRVLPPPAWAGALGPA